MELKKVRCWHCDKTIEGIISRHHIFNVADIKKKLYDTFKAPETDAEHILMHQLINLIKTNVPSFPVHLECHKEIEKKLANLKAKETSIYKKIEEIEKEIKSLR